MRHRSPDNAPCEAYITSRFDLSTAGPRQKAHTRTCTYTQTKGTDLFVNGSAATKPLRTQRLKITINFLVIQKSTLNSYQNVAKLVKNGTNGV